MSQFDQVKPKCSIIVITDPTLPNQGRSHLIAEQQQTQGEKGETSANGRLHPETFEVRIDHEPLDRLSSFLELRSTLAGSRSSGSDH